MGGGIQGRSTLTLLAGSGMVVLDDLSTVASGAVLTLNADSDGSGDGTLTVHAGKTVKTTNGAMLVTAWDIDLHGALDSGDAALTIHAFRLEQSVGLVGSADPALRQDMHITDTELLKITARGSVTFQRAGAGTMVVHSISRKYATKPDGIVFGANYFTNPSYSQHIVSSANREAHITQVMMRAYQTPSDFDDMPGMARLTVPHSVEHGSNLVVQYVPDVYTTRATKPLDWIGLYRAGECDDDSQPNRDAVIHKCWLAWRSVQPGQHSGEVSFTVEDYKDAGKFEVRYFYGDSNGGQGYRCVLLGNVGQVYKHCLLRARATSDAVTVMMTGTSEAARAMPGLQEHYCDGANGLCTW